MIPHITLAGRGGSVDLSAIFNGKLVIDPAVSLFLGVESSKLLSFTEPNQFYANWVPNPGTMLPKIDRNTALGILRFLDGKLTSSETPTILESENEMNLIFGTILLRDKYRVLYLEHEYEDGKEEEYHLRSPYLFLYPLEKKNNRRYLQLE